MRVTIIPSDKALYVDGAFKENLNLSGCGIPENIHALQWIDTHGWVEFSVDSQIGEKLENEEITKLPDWANACLDVWNAAVNEAVR